MRELKKPLLIFFLVLFSVLFSFFGLDQVKAAVLFPSSEWTRTVASYSTGMDIDSSGNIYISSGYGSSDTYNRIYKYNSSGTQLGYFGGYGTADGKFRLPEDVAVDDSGNIYVVEYYNRIQKFNSSFNFLWKAGSTGTGDGQFDNPTGIAVNSDTGLVYVADRDNSRIQVFDASTGAFVEKFESSLLSNIEKIEIDSTGNIYIGAKTNIKVFDSDFNFIKQYGSDYSSDLGKFKEIRSLAIGSDDSLYVADRYGDKVDRITSTGVFLIPIDFNTIGSVMEDPRAVGVDQSGNVFFTRMNSTTLRKVSFSNTGYQIAGLDSSLDIIYPLYQTLSVETSSLSGVNSASAALRLQNTDGLVISDVTVDMTADRDWTGVSADSSLELGKSFVNNLTSAPGASATHTLYVPVPVGRTSNAVLICPNATNMTEVDVLCSGGVSRGVGSYTESFGNITVSQVSNLGDNRTYWKIEGMTGSGGMAEDFVEYTGTGSGTELDPYEVTSCSELQEMQYNFASNYELLNNIDCSDTINWNTGEGFRPIGTLSNPFQGSLDGNGYTISDVYIYKNTDYIGLFGILQNAEIVDLDLLNIEYEYAQDPDSPDYIGGLAGDLISSTITNVHVQGSLTHLGTNWLNYIGGLSGRASGTSVITFSSTDIDIVNTLDEGSEFIGGFIGRSIDNVLVEDSTAEVYIRTGRAYDTGGFFGSQSGSAVTNRCSSSGTLHVGLNHPDAWSGTYDVGGFVGSLGVSSVDAEINDSFSTVNLRMEGDDIWDVGGFVGTIYEYSTITNSYSTGDIVAIARQHDSIGGFAGLTRRFYSSSTELATILNSYTTSSIYVENAATDIGGFVGEQRSGLIEDAYATGDIKIRATSYGDNAYLYNTGGFVGASQATINRAISTGSILISNYELVYETGGFGGFLDYWTEVDQTASFGSIVILDTQYTYDVGGFVGSTRTTLGAPNIISNSYSRGSVINLATNAEPTAGFLGSDADVWDTGDPVYEIINSYSTGTVITNGYPLYGFIDYNTTGFLDITSSYWDTESSGISNSNGGVGYTTAQLKNSSNLTGWNFADIWGYNASLNDGYPIFQWQTLAPNLVGESSPDIYLDSVVPNPTSDTTPSITGFAIDVSNVAEVSFQMNGTSSSWEECVAIDGTFDSVYEPFRCSISMNKSLEEGEHTMYVKASNDLAVNTPLGEEVSVTFEVNTSQEGLAIENNEILRDGGDFGSGNSIAVGPDGNPLISHVDWNTNNLLLVICSDQDCSSFSEVVVEEGTASPSPFTSLDIGNDGFARIAFHNTNTNNLRFARCNDASCSAPVINDIPIPAGLENDIVLKMTSDGYPRIMARSTDGIGYFVSCTDANCSAYNSVAITENIGNSLSMDMILNGSDIPLYVYQNRNTYELKYGYCTDSSCSGHNTAVVSEDDGEGATIAIGSDGFARMAYMENYYGTLSFAKCSDLACSSITKQRFEGYSPDGYGRSSIGLLAGDIPFISYTNETTDYLYGVECKDDTCSDWTSITIENGIGVDGGYGKDMTISDDKQDIFISYYDSSNYYLGYAHLAPLSVTTPGIILDSVPAEITTRNYNITGSATDIGETVYGVHFQVDGYLYEGWSMCTADDGAFDEATEDFTCNLTGLSNGEHTVYVRAVDSAGNATVYPNHATATFTVNATNSEPNSPTSLVQYKSNGTTVLTVGGSTDETTVVVKMNISDPDGSGTLTPQVEIRPTGVNFTDTVTNTGSGISFTGTPLTAQLLITGLTDGFSYHWQARVCDEGSLCSDWVSYGLNAESSADFTVMLNSQGEEVEEPVVLPPTPSPSTPPVDVEEEVVEEEQPIEEENEDYTPPTEEPSEDEEEKESIFVTISNGVKELTTNIAKGISNIDVPKDVSESIAVTGIAVVSTHALLTNFVTLAGTQSLSSLQLLSSFFLIGGLKRKKNQKYSLVYDSVSKEPINMATVRVMDETGKLVTTVVTDVYGVFDLKIPDGKYSFSVVSRNHSFPSQAVLGTTDDPYQNVYKGGLVEYSSNTGVNISIPMDKEEKGFLGVMFSSSRSAFVSILNVLLKVLFVVGFGMTVISLVKEPSTLIWLSFGMYILLILLYLLFAYRDRRSFGVVRSTQGNMLEGLEIGVRELEFDTIYAKRVSDEKGKYRFILPGGKYRLEILNSNYELVDTPNDTFEIKDGSLFIVKEDIVVRRKV